MRKLDTMEKFPETVEMEVLPVMECKLTDHRGPVRRFFGMFNPFKFRRRAGIRIDFLTLLLEAVYHAIDHQLGLFRQRVKRMDEAFIAYGETVEGRLKIAREELDRLEKRESIHSGWLNRIGGNLDALGENARDLREFVENNATVSAEAFNQLRGYVLEALKLFDARLEALKRFDARLEAVENSAKKPAPRVAKSPYTPRKTPVRKGAKR